MFLITQKSTATPTGVLFTLNKSFLPNQAQHRRGGDAETNLAMSSLRHENSTIINKVFGTIRFCFVSFTGTLFL